MSWPAFVGFPKKEVQRAMDSRRQRKAELGKESSESCAEKEKVGRWTAEEPERRRVRM